MLKSIRTQISPIGLVHDSNEFRAVQLIRSRSGVKPIACVDFPRMIGRSGPVDAEEYRWAGELLARRGMVGNSISIIPDSAWCSSHMLELPPVTDQNAKLQLARAEIARSLKCPPNEFELGTWDLPAKGRTNESMAISCKRSDLDKTLDRLQEAGMDALSVDLMELAVSRTLAELVQSDDITGVLHIGWDGSLLVIQNQGAIVYQRRVEEGLADIHRRLCEQFALEDAAARYLIERMHKGELEEHERPARMVWQALIRSLSENLDVAIGYVSHAYRMAELGSVYLSGYGASNEDLHSEIDQRIGMPVHTLSAPTLLSAGVAPEQCARFTIPYGLAARFDKL